MTPARSRTRARPVLDPAESPPPGGRAKTANGGLMKNHSRLKLSLLAAAAACALFPSAHAQTTDEAQQPITVAQTEPDEVVIVNARRRAEDVQSVPVAVSAIPFEMIE